MGNDCEDLITDLYRRINQASMEAIPVAEWGKFYPKPWWSEEVRQSKVKRERLYQVYRRNKTYGNMIAWKKCRAEHKKLIRKNKRESWIQFVEKLKYGVHPSVIYEAIRRIKGQPPRKTHILIDNNQVYATVPEIAEQLAATFCRVSSDENYSPEFRAHKDTAEQEDISFESSNREEYNRPFTVEELEYNLSRTKNTSPGKDGIHYQMLKKMPPEAKKYLCKIFNRLWQTSYFPPQWNTAIVVPIHKPGKNHSNSSNYRPIALTSCICKLLERMINERLMDFMEMNRLFSNVQCGCRREKSTLDHLVRMESAVRNAFVLGEHQVSIFFDMEKAYDMTWRFGIMRDLHDLGLRGLLPKYIGKYLKERRFAVKVQNHYSNIYPQKNGVPQGSVLAVTLFAIKINEIAKLIPQNSRFISSLYVDDLQIGYRHSDLRVLKKELQRCLNRISDWTQRNGFKFSTTKTKAMHFTTLPGTHPHPDLKLHNLKIPYAETVKFLGLMWDTKLLWKNHIAKLRADCLKLVGMLKMITTQQWGSDQSSAMKVYRMYIRSKIDYGAPVYSSAAKSTLASLDTVITECLRIATGAFKTTPTETLHVLANEMTPQHRRQYLSLRYFYKIKSSISNPAKSQLIPLPYRRLFLNKGIVTPLNQKIQDMLDKYKLRKQFVKPEFSYRILNITQPTWSLESLSINMDLASFPKLVTPQEKYRQEYKRACEEKYKNWIKLYTDGSKREEGVGAAAVWNGGIRSAALPREASIFSAELYAITMAVRVIEELQGTQFVVFSDSSSVLKALMYKRNRHPVTRKLQHDIAHLKSRNKEVHLCWIPGHAGIQGNEEADRVAVDAAKRREQYIPVFYKDWYPVITQAIEEDWNHEWESKNQKMYEIKKKIGEWKGSKKRSRREEVVLNRLRSGHTRLTHGYLMENEGPRMPPICTFCRDAIMSVKHILLRCPSLGHERDRLRIFQGTINVTLEQLISDKAPVDQVMEFLRRINIYDAI